MSEDARSLAMYLITSPHSTIAGAFRLPDGYVCEDMQWTQEWVCEGFKELLAKGYAYRCETTKWVWICKHFEWNQPENPNQRKAAAKVAESIPAECVWKLDFMRVCGDFLTSDGDGKANPSETVIEPFPNQKQKQKQKQDIPSSPIGADLFGEFWKAYPKKVGKDAARKAFAKRKPSKALCADMVAAIAEQSQTDAWQKNGGQFIPHPSTWLNEGRWQDETGQPETRGGLLAGAI